MTSLRLLIAFAAFATAGCNADYSNPRLDYRVIGVRGVVSDAAQSPISAATVTVSAYLFSCSGALDGSAVTQTGPDGRYVTRLSGSTLSQPRCVRVNASKGALNGSAVLSTVVFPVRVPTDTIDLNVVLSN